MSDGELRQMIADYMENGFLENIIDMFRHDSGLYSLVGELIQDERVRVRLGITAMMEELSRSDAAAAAGAVSGLLPLLRHTEAHIRGDAANLLGLIGDESALPFLRDALRDDNPSVRLLVQEAIAELTGN